MAESREEVIAETIHEKTRGCEDAGVVLPIWPS